MALRDVQKLFSTRKCVGQDQIKVMNGSGRSADSSNRPMQMRRSPSPTRHLTPQTMDPTTLSFPAPLPPTPTLPTLPNIPNAVQVAALGPPPTVADPTYKTLQDILGTLFTDDAAQIARLKTDLLTRNTAKSLKDLLNYALQNVGLDELTDFLKDVREEKRLAAAEHAPPPAPAPPVEEPPKDVAEEPPKKKSQDDR